MFNFNKLIILYVDKNGYSDIPLYKTCFNSIKETFPEGKFINLPSKYIDKVNTHHFKMSNAWTALYARLEYIKDHPNQYIVSPELDVYISDKQKVRNFILYIFNRQQTYYFGTDAFMISYKSSEEVSRQLSIIYNKRNFSYIAPWILYIKKYQEVNIEYYNNYFYHFGDISYTSSTATNLIIIRDELEDLNISYLPNTIILKKSSIKSGRWGPHLSNIGWTLDKYGSFGYWLVSPKLLNLLILYIQSKKPKISIKTMSSHDFNMLYKDRRLPTESFWLIGDNFIVNNNNSIENFCKQYNLKLLKQTKEK